ncbi:MAG: hypothetical protein L6V95_04050 [Candidatus Melainabacteria bacterium]|nr:MAG: hypothetical protein L6V95_04050 [Candidatus Melainabacteria bacterium]
MLCSQILQRLKKDTINAVEVDKLDAATRDKYLDKLYKIVSQTSSAINQVKDTANAQIAQIVMLTEDINVTPEMINAVDVTKLDETTEYVTKLSNIATNPSTSVKADVKTAANAQIVMLTDPTKVQKIRLTLSRLTNLMLQPKIIT